MADRFRRCIRKNILPILTVVSVIIGIALGLTLRGAAPTPRTVTLIGFPGEILLNVLKMLIIPLIASSLISGLSHLDLRQSKRIGAFALLFYATTMSAAVATGMVLVLIVHPGDPSIRQATSAGENFVSKNAAMPNISAVDKALNLIRNMFPESIVQATFQQVETNYVEEKYQPLQPNGTSIVVVKAIHRHVDGMNVLGIMVFCITMGLVMGAMGTRAKPLADFFTSLNAVILAIVWLVMWYSPMGIASLIAAKLLEIGDVGKTARMLSAYVFTVVLGLLVQCFITLPLVLYAASRRNPFTFMRGLSQAALTGLGTASSAASLPVTFRCLEEKNGVNPKYTNFVLPVGAVVNMDGTALYEAVTAVFIAQMNGVAMGFGTVLSISVITTLVAIGGAAIPSAGLVSMLVVLTAVGLPTSDIAMVVSVDWMLDRLRTAVNVMGDGFGCGFVQAMMERYCSGDKVLDRCSRRAHERTNGPEVAGP